MRALVGRFKDWKQASLFRRTVVTVATFTMLACVSIATMSFVAVSATRAVFKPSAEATPSAAPAGNGPLQVANAKGGADRPANNKAPSLRAGAD